MTKTNIPPFKLIGIKLNGKTSNEGGQSGIDCGNLWQKFEKGNFRDKIPGKLNDKLYAVYFDYEGDHTKPFSYFIGCKVEVDTEVPEGLDSLTIPEQHYFKAVAQGKMPDCIANAWKDIWKSDSDRAYTYDFEVYDERSADWSHAEVDIFVSTSRAE